MKFGHLNVRSLLSEFDLFCEFINNEKFEVFAVSETWLNVNIHSDVVSIPQYHCVRADRDGRGGGVAFYIKKSLQYKVILQKLDTQLEQLWISMIISGKKICTRNLV